MNKRFLEGERIYLRDVRETDVNDKYYSWLDDPAVNKYLETRFEHQSKEKILNFVKNLAGNENEHFFAICIKENDEHIGNIKLGPINNHHKNADISLFIGEKAFWGKGIASEAIRVITKYGFLTLALNKLKAGAYASNLGSINAFKKNGYKQEALLREHVFSDGKFEDVVLLGITRKDFGEINK